MTNSDNTASSEMAEAVPSPPPKCVSPRLLKSPREAPTTSQRLASMGLNAATVKIASDKVNAVSSEQRKKIKFECAVAAQVQPPTAAEVHLKARSHPRKTSHRKLLVFDLDETLVHCSNSLQHCDLAVQLPDSRTVGVHIRPFARDCLRELSASFEVAVFTAAQECYARPVIAALDPAHAYIQHCLFRDSCLEAGHFVLKDLRVFREFALKDVVMVDNSVFGFAFQRGNGVPVSSWVGDPGDTELRTLVPYLQLLVSLSDVRPFNYSVFSPLYENH